MKGPEKTFKETENRLVAAWGWLMRQLKVMAEEWEVSLRAIGKIFTVIMVMNEHSVKMLEATN